MGTEHVSDANWDGYVPRRIALLACTHLTPNLVRVIAQNLLQLPNLIRLARLRAGLSQKALALSIGLNQSLLCAIEKGRRPVCAQELLDGIGRATAMTKGECEMLRWAMAHDQLIVAAQRMSLQPETLRFVSIGMRATRMLDSDELLGMEEALEEAIRSKELLKDYANRLSTRREELSMR